MRRNRRFFIYKPQNKNEVSFTNFIFSSSCKYNYSSISVFQDKNTINPNRIFIRLFFIQALKNSELYIAIFIY